MQTETSLSSNASSAVSQALSLPNIINDLVAEWEQTQAAD